MPRRCSFAVCAIAVAALWAVREARADDTLYRFEGNVLLTDPSTGWLVFDPCESPCVESAENGHFVLRFPELGGFGNNHLWIAQADDPPPPDSLWVEWRFRSNHSLGPVFTGCDASFWFHYGGISEPINLYGDAALSSFGTGAIFGLALNEFHTYRVESPDGMNYRVSVDGTVFIDRAEDSENRVHFLQLRANNGCLGDFLIDKINEWDFVRYGSISAGEQIVATDPPAGFLDPGVYGGVDRFTVTFDAANYVYVDDITVSVTGGVAPVVLQTRRMENGEPDTVEIVLDRPLAFGETTTFTITDGVATHVVAYKPDFDDDGDGVFNSEDNCPSHANPDQADCDDDGVGDVCTLATCTGDEACADCDGNQQPDACDEDADGDGTINACDGCPEDASKLTPGVCGCGTPDDDTDLDTVPDCNDQCPDEDDLRDGNDNGLPDCVEGLVPSLTGWGMLALTLLLLAGGKILFYRHRTPGKTSIER